MGHVFLLDAGSETGADVGMMEVKHLYLSDPREISFADEEIVFVGVVEGSTHF